MFSCEYCEIFKNNYFICKTFFIVKHLSPSLFFHKVAGLRPATLIKKRPWHKCFPMNFAKLLRRLILKNIYERLILVAGWRTTQKLSRKDSLLLICLVYTNTSVARFFPSIIYDFLYIFVLILTKLSLQMEYYMENFGLFYNIKSQNKTEFSDWTHKYNHVESAG